MSSCDRDIVASGKLAKLHTMVASNNKDRPTRSLYSIIAWSRHSSTSRLWWIAHSTTRRPRVCNNTEASPNKKMKWYTQQFKVEWLKNPDLKDLLQQGSGN